MSVFNYFQTSAKTRNTLSRKTWKTDSSNTMITRKKIYYGTEEFKRTVEMQEQVEGKGIVHLPHDSLEENDR